MMISTDHHEYAVNKEFDVVVLRQAIREVARTLELSLIQQARITAAISDIARDLLTHHLCMVFSILVHPVGLRRALDVVCQKPDQEPHPSDRSFEHIISIESARQLLDEATFSHASGCPLLTLRIWI